jgi:hypothetical protein
MEVVPFTFALTRAARRASEWSEEASMVTRGELVALAGLVPLLRPEGALASVAIALALLSTRRGPVRRDVVSGLLALSLAIAPQLLSWLFTGHFRSNTAQVKLLPGNPYYVGPALVAVIQQNVHTLIHVLLNGEIWSAEFLPHGAMPVGFLGLAAVAYRGWAVPARFRAATVVLLAVAIAVPCGYVSFLWNRLRYLWPFSPFWLIGLACLARVIGDVAGRARPRWRVITPVLAGGVAGLLAMKLEGTIDDLAMSASGIDRQQVALGQWARDAIPAGARIGVNDTGAIAYFSDHPTFDVCGLTTEGEGRYWVAGAASRFEHYERLFRASPEALPRYFIVYPEWMTMSPVLGARLHEATVTDSTILGGGTMVAYEADYTQLGSGEEPWTKLGAPVTDSLDVADLDSEATHHYELLGAADGEEILTEGMTPDGTTIVDGGRRERRRERFRVSLGAPGPALGVVRLETSADTVVSVTVDGRDVGRLLATAGPWQEVRFAAPHVAQEPTVELVADAGTLTTYHYWFFARGLPEDPAPLPPQRDDR